MKGSIYNRFKTYINKNKGNKELKNQKMKDDGAIDDFSTRLAPHISDSSEKRRQTITESLAGKGEF